MIAHHPPRVLTVAGSDSSGAAGVQADLKTFAARGVIGFSALTLVTAQNSTGIQALHTLPLDLIGAQIDSALSDSGVDALKTGLLLRAEVIGLVAAKAAQYGIENLIVDPVMVAGDGRRLLTEEADRAYRIELFPRALIITPNLHEAALLSGQAVSTVAEMRAAARKLYETGPRYVLIKGGHLPEQSEIVDLLYDGSTFTEYSAARLPQWNARGTGCTFASTIAAEVAKGATVPAAVQTAKEYVTGALRAALGWQIGSGRGMVDHAWETRTL